VNTIPEEAAFHQLEQWRRERGTMDVALARSSRQRSVGEAAVNQVLPHSRKVLLMMNDEHGIGVAVTVSLEGAAWEYAPDGGVVPEFSDVNWAEYLSARFANGSRYVFGRRVG
jgi:hypothetical protein